ncbi:MAG: Ribosomal protein L11 methyltransferase [Ignavibacteria bacterium]|nr:Ribosomal protein L11 methyltransferase [Ignavibacteria bacterium]
MADKMFEVRIAFSKNNHEELQNALYMDGIKNILEEEGQLIIYFEENESESIESLKSSLLNEKIIREKDFSVNKFENKNWNEEWEKSIQPVYIRNKIIVYPSWKKNELKNTDDMILIEIDPKMSFGTGHNETTQLVLELMCDNLEGSEEKLLDFGCGTGILSIAGIKLGVNSAVAIDTDGDSFENAKEYFKKNGVHQRIKLLQSGLSELEDDSFDVVCANIIRSVIIENIEHISNKINSRGKLFVSGILISEDQEILEYLTQNDFEVIDIASKAEWIGIYAVKM